VPHTFELPPPSYPSLGWQLLVHLYYANERVILLVDHSRPLSIAALDTTTPCKVEIRARCSLQ